MSAVTQKSALNIVMVRIHFLLKANSALTLNAKGAMTFGEAGKEGARVHDLKDVEAILDVFQKHGHYEVNPLHYIMDNKENLTITIALG